jgi:uncharacterized protein (DUF885 family)
MLDRRQLLASATALAAGAALPRLAWAEAPANPTEARLSQLLDRFFYERLDDSPQSAASLGLDKGERAALKSRLDDRSAAHKARQLERDKAQLAALGGVDRAALGPAAQVDYDVVAYQLRTSVDGGDKFKFGSVGGRYSPYVISQLTGAYQDIPDFLDNQHRVDTGGDADAYLERLHGFARALDQDLDRARADVAAGVVPPDFALDTAAAQLQALRGAPAGQTVLVQSLARKAKAAGLDDGGYAAKAEAIVSGEVYPALDRQLAFVTGLKAKAPHDAGVWRLPPGDPYYAAALASATTTTLKPAEVHQMGLDQVAEITGRLDAILKARGLSKGSVAERLTALNDDPAQLYPNTDEGRVALIDQLNRQIDQVYGKLPEVFRTIPSTKVVVKRVPPFIQDGAPNGYYQRAALDGSRPAIYFINLKDTHDWPKFSLPTLTYHEAVPGHHLQISIQQSSTRIPLIRRTAGFSAFSEGWALYSEQLADEIGMYAGDPLGEAGFLQSFLFRAVRLVVDTGMHFKRWSREQAIDYMVAKTGYTRGRVQREIDRYCVWPGQACSYKVGHTVWTRVRADAKQKLGARFDIKDFHDAALLNGAVPLTVLEGVIGRWSAGKAA